MIRDWRLFMASPRISRMYEIEINKKTRLLSVANRHRSSFSVQEITTDHASKKFRTFKVKLNFERRTISQGFSLRFYIAGASDFYINTYVFLY